MVKPNQKAKQNLINNNKKGLSFDSPFLLAARVQRKTTWGR